MMEFCSTQVLLLALALEVSPPLLGLSSIFSCTSALRA